LFGLETFLPASLVLAFALGLGFMTEFTMINTLLQTRVADALRGRVMALYALTFFGFAPFGNLAIGALAARIGLSPSFGIFALISLVSSVLVLRLVPSIRELP
jgi:MFS family permease